MYSFHWETSDGVEKKYFIMMAGKFLLNLPAARELERQIIQNSVWGIRHGHTMRGKPAGVARTLEQRLIGTVICKVMFCTANNFDFPQMKQTRTLLTRTLSARLTLAFHNCDRRERSRSKIDWLI